MTEAGEVQVTIKAKGKQRKKLKKAGKVTLTANVTFTATGGEPNAETKKVGGKTVVHKRVRSGASRARTGDLVLARDALSQLSYGPRTPIVLGTIEGSPLQRADRVL